MQNYVKAHINQILSYLNAKNDNYNNIVTIPATERNPSNGFSQFILQANIPVGRLYTATKFNLRVETFVWENILSLKSNKAAFIERADMLIFGKENENSIYISTCLDWINDTKYYTSKVQHGYLGDFAIRNYNIDLLMKDNKVILIQNEQLQLFEACGAIYDIKIDDTKVCDIYGYAEKSCDDILYVQNDRKTGAIVWYTFYDGRYTNTASTVKDITKYICGLDSSLKEDYVQRTIYRAIENHKSEVSIKIDTKVRDKLVSSLKVPASFFDDNKIVIRLSENKGTDMWKIYEDAKSMKFEDWSKVYNMSKPTWIKYKKFPFI